MKKLILLFIVLMFSINFIIAETPPSGGVNYWNFSSVTDLWGSDDGTNNGATSVSDYPVFNLSGDAGNNSYDFEASESDYIDFSSKVIPTGAKTISVWTKPESITALDIVTDNHGIGGTIGTTFMISNVVSDKMDVFEGGGSGIIARVQSSTDVSTTTWQHWVYTWDGTTGSNKVIIYLNGTQDNTATATDVQGSPAAQNTRIGAAGGGTPSNYWDGKLDLIKFYNRSINATEVANLFNCNNITSCDVTPAGNPYPTITQNTYNCTSCYQNQTVWRTNTSLQPKTKDRTPTVIFNTDINSNCSIGLYNLNYTAMIANNSDTECSTSGTTSHTCTVPESEQLSDGDNLLYIGCIREDGLNETVTSTSGSLNISQDYIMMGTVKDDDGNAIVGAYVEVRDEATNLSTNITYSNSTGGWYSYVPMGTYSVYSYNLNTSLSGDIKSHITVP